MPAVTHNIILQGISGKLGNIVVRQLKGKTIVQAAPIRKAPATPGELANRETFKKAVAYAKEARQDSAVWEIYTTEAKRRGGTSNAFAVAVSDFRKDLGLVKVTQSTKPEGNKPVLKRGAFTFLYNTNIIANTALRYNQSTPSLIEEDYGNAGKTGIGGFVTFQRLANNFILYPNTEKEPKYSLTAKSKSSYSMLSVKL